jgi:cbb3-type cytochrome oxidase subunit 3
MNIPSMDESVTQQTLETMLSPMVYVLQSLWMNVFMGLFVGFIVAAFAKKEKNLFEE